LLVVKHMYTLILYTGFSIHYQYQHADGLNIAHPPRDWVAVFYAAPAPPTVQQQQQQQQQGHSKHDRHAKPTTAITTATTTSGSSEGVTAVHEPDHSKQNRFAAAVTTAVTAAVSVTTAATVEKPLDWRMVGWRLVPPANTGSVSAEPVMQLPGLYKAQYFLGSSSVAVAESNTFSVQCTRVRIGPVTTSSSATSGTLQLAETVAVVPCAAQLAFAYSYSLRSAAHCTSDWAGIVPLGEAVCARNCVVTAQLPAANSGIVLFDEGPTFPGRYAVHVFLGQHGDAPRGASPPFFCRLFLPATTAPTSISTTTAASIVPSRGSSERTTATAKTFASGGSSDRSGAAAAAAIQRQQAEQQQQQQQRRSRCASFYVSTRWDMVLEREALRAAAQPALTQLFDDRRVTFRLIDLRSELPAQALSTADGVSAALTAVAHCAPLLLCCLGELNDVELTAARSTDAAMLRAHPWVKDLLHPLRNSNPSSDTTGSFISSSEVIASDSRNPPARVSLTDVEVMFAHLLPALQRRVLHDSTPYSSSSSSSCTNSVQCEAQQPLTLLGQFRAARAKCCEPVATAGSRGAAPDVGQPLTSVQQGETAAATTTRAVTGSSISRAVNSSGCLFYTQHASKRSRVHPGMGGPANVNSSSTGTGTGTGSSGGGGTIGGIAAAIACMNDSKRHMVRLKHEVASANSSSSGSVSATSRGDAPVQLPPHYQTPNDLVAKVVADVTAYADRMYPVATLPTPREAAAMYSNEQGEWLLCSQRYLPQLARTLYKTVSSEDAASGAASAAAAAADVVAMMQSPKHSAAASSRKTTSTHSSSNSGSSSVKRKPNSGKQRSNRTAASSSASSFAEKLEYVPAAATDEAAAAVTAATVTKPVTAVNSTTKSSTPRSFNAVLADYINCVDTSAQSLALAVVDHAGAGCTTALAAFMAWFCCASSSGDAQQVVVERTELGLTDAIQQYGRAPLARAVVWRQRWSAQELRYYRTSNSGSSSGSGSSGGAKRASFVRTLLNRRTLLLYIDAADVTAKWTAAALASHICAEVYDVFELPLPATAVHDTSSNSGGAVSAAAAAAALLRGIELNHTDAAIATGSEQHDALVSTTKAQAAAIVAAAAQFTAMLQALVRADVGDLVLVIDGLDAITLTTARSDSISVQQQADSDSTVSTAAQQLYSSISSSNNSTVLSFLPRLLPPCLRVVAAARAGGAAAAAIDKEPGARWRILRRKCHLSADDKLAVVNAVLLRRGKACCSDAVRSSIVLTERTANVQYLEQVSAVHVLCYVRILYDASIANS
jgi:trimeric autotransporter adhesin